MARLLYASAKMQVRDRQGLFWALAFPLIFTVIFCLFDPGGPPEATLAIIGEDGPVPGGG